MTIESRERAPNQDANLARRRLIFALKFVLAILILALLIRAIGWERVRPALQETEPRWLLVMYGVTFSAMFANAAIIRFLLIRVHLRVTFRRVMLANALSTFYTLILPSDVLAGLAKWADLSAATGDKSRVFSALVFSKLALSLPPLILGTAALAMQNPLESRSIPVTAGLLAITVVAATAFVLSHEAGKKFDNLVLKISGRLPRFLSTKVESILVAVKDFRGLGVYDHLLVLAFSLCAFSLGILGFACASAAAGVVVPIATLMWVSMILFLTRMLPITLSNLGVREGVVIASFALFGVAPASALLVGLILFTNTIIVAIFGAVYQLSVANGWIRWRSS